MINCYERKTKQTRAAKFPARAPQHDHRPWPRLARVAGFLGVMLLALALCPAARSAQSASLSWDASPDVTVTGYNIYYGGASGVYTNTVSVGNQLSAVISGLDEGGTYYFVLTAFDALGVESIYSNEASYLVPPLVTALKLQIGGAAGGAFMLTGAGRSGHTYEIQATTNFTDWTVIGSQTVGTDGVFAFSDSTAANFPNRFYRTRDTQP